MKIIVCDFIANLGKKAIHQLVIGKHSLHDTINDNGQSLINYGGSINLVTGITLHSFNNIQGQMDWSIVNQIDYILIGRHHKSNLQNLKTFR